MQSARKQKLLIVLFILLGSAATVGLLLYAFDQGLNAFFTPTEIAEGKVQGQQNIRIGGMVKTGSLQREELDGNRVEFITWDFVKEVKVVYNGSLPDLFREGQGVVAEGYVDADGVFHANVILAKHDENYMSAEVKAALEAAGKYDAGAAVGELR